MKSSLFAADRRKGFILLSGYRHFGATLISFSLLFFITCQAAGVPLASGSASKIPQAPMRQQAQQAAQQPMKINVRIVTGGVRIGDKVSGQVTLLNSDNQPKNGNRQYQIELSMTSPSGKAEKQTVTIAAGKNVVQFTFIAKEVGLLQVKARETNDTLLQGGGSVLVGPPRTATQQKKKTTRGLLFVPMQDPRHPSLNAYKGRYLLARLETPLGSDQGSDGMGSPPIPSSPQLLLSNSGGRDEILADGKDSATIRVDYMDPEGPAPKDIKIWLLWSNGNPNPLTLVIKKGEAFAEAQWSSISSVNATVRLVNSAPNYPVYGDSTLHVSFIPPIYGIAPSSPNPLRLSLIDDWPLVAQFFDCEGRPVQTSKPRHVTFISSNAWLHIDPSSQDVPSNNSDASVFLLPTWLGQSELTISTPGYDHQTLVIQVTVWLVLLLCVSGGVLGGIAAKEALKASVLWRIFVGVLGAIVLVWLCVFAVLPQTHSIIAHNLVSVFVVGIVGGYGGTRVLDFAGKKLGYL